MAADQWTWVIAVIADIGKGKTLPRMNTDGTDLKGVSPQTQRRGENKVKSGDQKKQSHH
ncbi:MAG TPA: hypothetical protein VFB79_02825 [Candidatus Angelobacter sp.]|nr:hypothetical protein [Candidatus Angelobacter sp.]